MIAAPLPAVVAVSDAINEPRYPSLKGIMGAKSKPTETLSLADVGVEAEPRRRGRLADDRARARRRRPPKGDQVKIEDDGSAAEKIVEYLAEKRLAVSTLVFLEHHDGALHEGRASASSPRRRRSAATSPASCSGSGVRDVAATAGAFGASTVYVVDDAALAAPLPQPRVDALEAVVARVGRRERPLRRLRARGRRRRRASPRGSTPGSTGTSPTSRLEGGELVGKRPALGDTVLVDVGWTTHAAARARPLRHLRPGRDGRHAPR